MSWIIGLLFIIILLCSFLILSKLSYKLPYNVKFGIYYIGCICIVLVSIPFMVIRPKDYRNALIPAKACVYLCKALGVSMEVRGLENVHKDHGSVVIMNHQSSLDLLVLANLWPIIGRATVVSKKEILYVPFFGFGAWLWGTLFIDRAKKRESIKSLSKESRAINERNCKLLLFPEGTRNISKSLELLPFKRGCFHIALQSQCPIQPVVMSKYWFLDNSKKVFLPGRAIIHILPEIPTKGMTEENLDQLMDKCQKLMQTEYSKISNEMK